jgi:hypothetical protein
LIEDLTPEQQQELHQRVLDAMTANRLGNAHAHRLLRKLFHKDSNGMPGLSSVDSEGNLSEMSWSIQ